MKASAFTDKKKKRFRLGASDVIRWVVLKTLKVDVESSKMKPINRRKHAMVDIS